MPITGLQLITVTGQYLYLDGTPAVGTVSFLNSTVIVNAAADEIVVPKLVTVTLDATGSFSVELPATNDPDFTPQNFTYTVIERIEGRLDRKYAVHIPVESVGATVDMSELAGVPGASGFDTRVVYVSHDQTITGVKTFATNPVFNDGAIPQSKVVDLVTLSTRVAAIEAAEPSEVTLNTAQIITADKSFAAGVGPIFDPTAGQGSPRRVLNLPFNGAITAFGRSGIEYNVARMNNNAGIDGGVWDDMLIGDQRVKWVSVGTKEGLDLIGNDIIDVRYLGNHIASVNTRLVQRRTGPGFDVGIATVNNDSRIKTRLLVNNYVTPADAYVRVQNAHLRLHLGTEDVNLFDADTATFETSVGSWAAVDANASIVRSTDAPITGAASGRVTVLVAGTAPSVQTPVGVAGVPVTGGASFKASLKSKPVGTPRTFFFQFRQYDAAGTLIVSTDSPHTPEVANTAVTASLEGTLATMTRFVGMRVFWVNEGVNAQHDIDDAVIGVDDITPTAVDWKATPTAAGAALIEGQSTLQGLGTAEVPLIVRGLVGQTSDLLQLRNSAGGVLARFSNAGILTLANHLAVGQATNPTGALLEVTNNQGVTWTGARIRGIAAQTGDLTQWQDSAGSVLARVAAGGGISNLSGIFESIDAKTTRLRALNTGTAGHVIEATLAGWSSDKFTVMSGGAASATLAEIGNTGHLLTLTTTTNPTLRVRAATSQTADLQKWQDSAGADLVRIQAAGLITTSAYIADSSINSYVLHSTSSINNRFRAAATTHRPLVVQGLAGQVADLQQWQDNVGNTLLGVDPSGTLEGLGGSFVLAPSAYAAHNARMVANAATQVPIVARGAVAQTGDLQQWQNSGGGVLAKVDAAGDVMSTTSTIKGPGYDTTITRTGWSASKSPASPGTPQTFDFAQLSADFAGTFTVRGMHNNGYSLETFMVVYSANAKQLVTIGSAEPYGPSTMTFALDTVNNRITITLTHSNSLHVLADVLSGTVTEL